MAGGITGGYNNPYGNGMMSQFGSPGAGAAGATGATGAAGTSSPKQHKFKFAKIADVVNDRGDDDK